jgi:hypothetical protein
MHPISISVVPRPLEREPRQRFVQTARMNRSAIDVHVVRIERAAASRFGERYRIENLERNSVDLGGARHLLLADRQRFAPSGDGVKQAERRYRRPTQRA